LSYTVPGQQEIILKSLFANFDGSGAAAAFLPCIRILAPGGGVVAEYITDTPVAAGASAEVTFAPFLRNAGGGTGTQLGIEHNGALVASEPNLDFEDGGTTWTVTDNPAQSRVEVTGTGGGGGTGLANAVMIKTNTQTVPGTTTAQITLDSTTFATTDGAIFTASGSNIVIHATGLYAVYCHFVDDNSSTNPLSTEFYPKILGGVVNPNNPWQLAVPRMFNTRGPSGLQGDDPIGGGTSDSIANFCIAYVSELNATVGAWLATLTASGITTSTCLLVVTQWQPISGADLASFPSYPF
jgi:hypothetical protein